MSFSGRYKIYQDIIIRLGYQFSLPSITAVLLLFIIGISVNTATGFSVNGRQVHNFAYAHKSCLLRLSHVVFGVVDAFLLGQDDVVCTDDLSSALEMMGLLGFLVGLCLDIFLWRRLMLFVMLIYGFQFLDRKGSLHKKNLSIIATIIIIGISVANIPIFQPYIINITLRIIQIYIKIQPLIDVLFLIDQLFHFYLMFLLKFQKIVYFEVIWQTFATLVLVREQLLRGLSGDFGVGVFVG